MIGKSRQEDQTLSFADNKEREVVIIDVAIQGDDRVKGKELEKLEKYQQLQRSGACEKSL